MNTLYQELIQLSKDNYHIRLEKEKQDKINYEMKITTAMNRLYYRIIGNDIEIKMRNAAQSGNNKCELFSFQVNETFETFPLIFLTRGPQRFNGLAYFEECNINPYMKQLQQHYHPFNVYFVSNKKKATISIMIAW